MTVFRKRVGGLVAALEHERFSSRNASTFAEAANTRLSLAMRLRTFRAPPQRGLKRVLQGLRASCRSACDLPALLLHPDSAHPKPDSLAPIPLETCVVPCSPCRSACALLRVGPSSRSCRAPFHWARARRSWLLLPRGQRTSLPMPVSLPAAQTRHRQLVAFASHPPNVPASHAVCSPAQALPTPTNQNTSARHGQSCHTYAYPRLPTVTASVQSEERGAMALLSSSHHHRSLHRQPPRVPPFPLSPHCPCVSPAAASRITALDLLTRSFVFFCLPCVD